MYGGKNHRPTHPMSDTTALSAQCTWLMGEAITNIWQANSELERAIISAAGKENLTKYVEGIGDTVAHLDKSISLLHNSAENIHRLVLAYSDLLAQCEAAGYRGNPFVSKLKEWDLKELLQQHLFLPAYQEAWEEVSNRIEKNNLIRYFKWEGDQFLRIVDPLQDLIRVMKTCKEVAEADPELFAKSIEFNEIPLRQYFFRVFNIWHSLDLMVSISTSISTELFYRLEGSGSLTVVPEIPTSVSVLRDSPARVPASW